MKEKKHSGWKLPLVILVLILAGFAAGWYYMRTWPLRFHGELDQFFGAGNWKTVSEQTKESMMYSDYIIVRSAPSLSGERAGRFHEWDIAFTNQDGEQELWIVSDHTLKINNDEHWFPLDPERYTARQALGQEMMEISFAMAGDQIHKEILQEFLPEADDQELMDGVCGNLCNSFGRVNTDETQLSLDDDPDLPWDEDVAEETDCGAV